MNNPKSRADLPKREGTLWEVTPLKVYYRRGTKVYLENEDKARRSTLICNCDTAEWADYIISCLGIRDMMQEIEDETRESYY